MVYDTHRPRQSEDDRLVDRFTRRETAAQRARSVARKRIDVPEAVINEFEQSLTRDTVREARAIAAHMTSTPGDRTVATKRTPTTKKAEPIPATTKSTAKSAVKAKPKKTAKKAKPTDRAAVLAAYMADKLKVQKQLKVGAVIVYHGRNESIDGKSVKVVGHETRGGVFVEHKDTRYVVSPRALLKPKQ
jgi:hypothetical protein